MGSAHSLFFIVDEALRRLCFFSPKRSPAEDVGQRAFDGRTMKHHRECDA